MGITRAQIARQLLAQGGMPMKEIKGQNHMLAYITPNEADKLVRLGGQETMTPEGIPAYPEYDNYGYSSQQDFDQGNYGASNDPTVSSYDNKNLSDDDLKALSYAVKPAPKKTFAQKIVDSIKNVSNFTPFGIARKGLGFLFDKFQNLRGFNPDGTRRTQAQFEQARRDRINQNRISNIMGRDAPFTQMTLENLAKLGYDGPLEGLIGSTNTTRSGTTDQNFPDRVEGIVSQAPTTFRDAMAQLNLERGVPRDQQFLTEAQKNYIDENKTIGSEDLGTVQQNIKDATGYDTTLAGLNKEQIDYLNTLDKRNKDVGNKGTSTLHNSLRFPDQPAGAFFSYKSPQEVLNTVMGLNEKSSTLFNNVDPEKNVYGDKNTFAQPDEITNYIQSLATEGDRTYSFGIPQNEPGKNYLELFKGGFIK